MNQTKRLMEKKLKRKPLSSPVSGWGVYGGKDLSRKTVKFSGLVSYSGASSAFRAAQISVSYNSARYQLTLWDHGYRATALCACLLHSFRWHSTHQQGEMSIEQAEWTCYLQQLLRSELTYLLTYLHTK